jgi:predicted CXXCH cytochrome family protein
MKKLLAAAMMIAFAASVAFAADTVVIKSKKGDITFNHAKHSADPASCKTCHGDAKPSKLTLGREAGHKLCIECHKEKKAGPTKCGDCHKK